MTKPKGTNIALGNYTTTRDGYVFEGWYADAALTAKTSSIVLNSSATVYANWVKAAAEPSYYTLTFESNGGASVSPYTGKAGSVVNVSLLPSSRSGYTFAGWYSDAALTKKVTSVTLNSDCTVYAKWTKNSGEGGNPNTGSTAASVFTDVLSSSRYASAIDYVYENGLMNGVSATEFDGYGNLSRAMIVTILYRQEGSPSVSSSGFSDVPAGKWYTAGVAWAAKNGMVNGYGNGKFGPEDDVTVEQMAAILYRYAQYKGISTSKLANTSGYSDFSRVSSWAQTSVRWALANAVIIPINTSIYPTAKASRGEAAIAFKGLNEI